MYENKNKNKEAEITIIDSFIHCPICGQAWTTSEEAIQCCE